MTRIRLRTRIFLTLLGTTILAVLLVSVLARRGTENEFNRFLARDFQRDQAVIAQLFEEQLRQGGVEDAQQLAEMVGKVYRVPVTIVNPSGQVLVASRRGDVGQVVALENAEKRPFSPHDPIQYRLDGDGHIQFTPPEIPEGAFRAPERGTQPGSLPNPSYDNQQTFIGSLNRFFWAIALGAVLITGVAGLWLAQRILQPVQALTLAAHKMAEGDLGQRVNVTSHDELGELSHSFNHMAAGLQKQETLRRNMVSDIAHELRTPLSNIRGYLEALQDGILEADEVTINSLHEESLLLNHLIEDLQELSLAEAGQLRLEPHACDVGGLVAQAVQSVQLAAAEKGITLAVDLPDNLPEAWADAERVLQILRNLLQNAVAYTPQGGTVTTTAVVATAVVATAVVATPAATSPATIEVAIRDTGPGIAAEHLPHLFDRFYRADKSRHRATGGTGLGLAITKALLDLQNGRIWVTSTVGEGSTFTFSLPQAEPGMT